MSTDKPSTLRTLFDLTFERFVIVQLVRWFYVASLAAAVLLLVGMLITGFNGFVDANAAIMALAEKGSGLAELRLASAERTTNILTMAAAPFAAVFLVLFARVFCELVVVAFRIAELLQRD